jgi:hypothetical protein
MKIRRSWDVFGKPQLTNILAIITSILTIGEIVVGIISIRVLLSPNQQPPIPSTSTQNIFLTLIVAIFISILILLTIINIMVQHGNTKRYKKYEIINILSGLQNKYILKADFKTLKEHGEHSKEKDLTSGGSAEILTNSLNYDYWYCDFIADNIIKGAKYTYFIPYKLHIPISGLENYITKLYNELYSKSIFSSYDPTRKDNAVKSILEKVEFYFFKSDTPCLYNFARFSQPGIQGFPQTWWYLNPKDHNDNSYMLSQEISEQDDQDQLYKVFNILRQNRTAMNASDIYDSHADITSLLGEQ